MNYFIISNSIFIPSNYSDETEGNWDATTSLASGVTRTPAPDEAIVSKSGTPTPHVPSDVHEAAPLHEAVLPSATPTSQSSAAVSSVSVKTFLMPTRPPVGPPQPFPSGSTGTGSGTGTDSGYAGSSSPPGNGMISTQGTSAQHPRPISHAFRDPVCAGVSPADWPAVYGVTKRATGGGHLNSSYGVTFPPPRQQQTPGQPPQEEAQKQSDLEPMTRSSSAVASPGKKAKKKCAR